jgi:signal transduction histidine kinase
MNPFRRAIKIAEDLLNSQSSEAGSAAMPTGRMRSAGSQAEKVDRSAEPVAEGTSAEEIESLRALANKDSRRAMRSTVTDVNTSYKPVDLQEHRSAWRSLWLAELARRGSKTESKLLNPPTDLELVRNRSLQLVSAIFDLLASLAEEFNGIGNFPSLRLTSTAPTDVREQDAKDPLTYHRCRVSTSAWSLSVRAKDDTVEMFLVPATEVMSFSNAEYASRQKAKLVLTQSGNGIFWARNGFPTDSVELRVLVRNCFKELLLSTIAELSNKNAEAGISEEPEEVASAIHNLVLEKHNLVQKIVIQQEEIQNNIARELHDAVISDVMMLKRALSGDKKLSNDEVIDVLDQITRHLREICNDLAPRDLKDWGLQTVLDDMLHRVAERTGADCSVNCEDELPELPNAVQLHIYRILQECLNNVEKYADASRIVVNIGLSETAPQTLQISVQDNGRGFELHEGSPRKGMDGGKGLGSMRERAELIRAFFPTRLWIESAPSKGSKTTLEIALSGTFSEG